MLSVCLSRIANLWRPIAMLVLVVALAACGRSPTEHLGVPGDNKPHPGVARARALPVQGLDVSRYQGQIDFDAARAGGTQFVYIKSTEGRDYIDPNFYENWRRARASGVAYGAYHFMTWCSLASEQAAWFIKKVPNDDNALPPVLDVEWNNHSSCRNKHDRTEILEKIRVMLAAMERHTGKVPVIYTDMNFHRDIFEGEHFDNPFWLRSTAAEPHTRYGARPYLFWQWTQTGTMAGIKTEVDRNAFAGSPDDWVTFVLTGCDPRSFERLAAEGRCRTMK